MLLYTAPFAVILSHTYNQHPLPKCFHTLSASHLIASHDTMHIYIIYLMRQGSKTLVNQKSTVWLREVSGVNSLNLHEKECLGRAETNS